MRFPLDFAWGAATAAYQIEGGWNLDGKGESNWDRRAHTPGQIRDGATGDVAIDHYHRWAEDVALMHGLGLTAYRFSISWSRVQPDGEGAFNEAGLAFYDRLIDALVAAGIRPFVTLCHYESPQALHDRFGAWRSRRMCHAFAAFAGAMARRYGDRVRDWMTLNEPLCIEDFLHGSCAPAERPALIHHLMLAHGLATRAIRSVDPGLRVGMVNCLWPIEAYAGDRLADDGGTVVRTGTGAVEPLALTPENLGRAVRLADAETNRMMLDPLYGRGYPEEAVALLAGPMPILPGDLDCIATPTDFYGLNYYSPIVVRPALREGRAGWAGVSCAERGVPSTTMGWEIRPEGILTMARRLHRDYGVAALHLSENGVAFEDQVLPDGRIDDHERIDFLRRHVAAVGEAIAEGIPMRGYFVWSLLDNFEWSLGWSQRFGLYHVDHRTLERRPKASAAWYRRVITSGGRDH